MSTDAVYICRKLSGGPDGADDRFAGHKVLKTNGRAVRSKTEDAGPEPVFEQDRLSSVGFISEEESEVSFLL